MSTPDKILAVACWWAPPIALIVVLVRDIPSLIKRHAWWALGYTILVSTIGLVVMFCLLLFGLSGPVTFGVFGVLGVAVSFAVLITNTVAVVADKGPFFTF